MKVISLAALSLVVGLSLQASPLDTKAVKITKNEAEHIALKQYPGAHVKMAKLGMVDGKLVWSVELADAKSQQPIELGVDATTGRVVSPRKGKP